MKYMITKHIEKLLHDKKVHKRYLAVFLCMAAVVVLGTVMLLRYSGIAMTHKEKILSCDYKAHEHEEGCYVMKDGEKVLNCGYADYVVHVHNDDCYDAEGNLVCTLLEIKEHKHDDSCYEEERVLTCSQQATEGHHHTDACYKQEQGGLICGFEEHAHTEDCYGEDGSLTCGKGEHVHSAECYEYTSVLACGMEENEGGHTHDDSCYETQKTLICQEPEIELHTHDENCYDEDENLICGKIQVESHVHSGDCFEIIEVTDNSQEETGNGDQSGEPQDAENGDQAGEPQDAENGENTDTGEIYTLNEEDEETGDAADDDQAEETPEPEKASKKAGARDASETLTVTLLYGDKKDHPDGASYLTHSTMSGFIKLEPKNLPEDLTDVTVTLEIPKQYVEEGTVNIPKFSANSDVTEYTIPDVREDEEYYYADIIFSAYDKTQTLVLPFALSFKDDVVPDNYELPVTATVTRNDGTGILDKTEDPLIYKPEYKEWGITKFVNSNKLEAFKDDGTEVVVTSKEPDGNPYLSDTQYVDFYFRVNNVANNGSNLDNFRDASEVTLTDALPRYTMKNGETAIAKFDSAVNEGWTLSEDRTKVSKTYTGENSREVLLKIYDDKPLKLQFPGLKFEKDPNDADNLIAEMDNEVDLLAIPSNADEDETRPMADDSLHFVITTDPSTKGSFTKQATKGNIYDTMEYKTNPYPWRIRLSNNGVQPLEHITIQDRKIEENGKVVLAGMDEDLKFVKLESDLSDSIPKTGRTFKDMVEKVVAYYTEGETQEYSITVDESGNFTIEFDKDRVCCGYEIIFKEDFKLLMTEAVSFMAYTKYRTPESTVVPDGTAKITYRNSARSVNSYKVYKDQKEEWEFKYITVTHSYDMLPVTEKLEIGKSTYANSSTENNMAGNKYRYWISLGGILSEAKEYGKIYIVDLLPNEVDFTKVTHGTELFTGGGSRYPGVSTGVSATPRIEENYHNSGRTALIWELPYETLKMHLASKENGLYYAVFQIEVQIREDAHPGTVRNNIYIVGENLDEYNLETGGAVDIYDLNNNGKTDDKIAWSSSDATIVAAEAIYAEKFIAPAGSNNWSKQGLSLKAGSEFDYKLKVENGTNEPQTGLVVYDALPAINDKGVLTSSAGRGSEFPVQLRGPITAPEGYEVYYTTDKSVNGSTMEEKVNAVEWTQNVNDWSAVTAFKLVANEGTSLIMSGQPFEVRVPACVPTDIPEESMEKLADKDYTDQTSGTTAYLQAVNNFGYTTNETPNPKQSNSVWVRIPFAGFTIKKVDQKSKEGLQGATFTLTKTGDSSFIRLADSNENGLLSFRDLTEGTYTLTETVVPDGYQNSDISLTVIITQDSNTGAYTVKFEGSEGSEFEGSKFEGSGTSNDPLIIENVPGYVLPKTGGVGIALYMVGGILMAVVASLLMYLRRKRARA